MKNWSLLALASQGIPQREICRVLAIDGKTLRKHFRDELDRGSAKFEAALVGHLLRLAGGSGGVAVKAIAFALRARFGWSEYAPPRSRDVPRSNDVPPENSSSRWPKIGEHFTSVFHFVG